MGVKLSKKYTTVFRGWANRDSVMSGFIFITSGKKTNAQGTKIYPASWTESAPVRSCRNLKDNKIALIFTASDTSSLKISMYAIFVVQKLCRSLTHKVQNSNPDRDKSITEMGLHNGCYFYFEPKVIRESNKNHICTRVGPSHLSHNLKGPDIRNY